MRRDWEKQEVETLREFASIKTSSEIAVILDRSQQSILSKASDLKISLIKRGENHHGVKLSDLQVEMARTLQESGFTDGEIHRACFDHVSMSVIQRITSFKSRLNVVK